MAARDVPSFAHPVEQAVASMLDDHGIAWEYGPHEFVLGRDGDGSVREALAPDFHLPEIGCYVECTVMRQSQTTRKNRKVRLAQELHHGVITLGLWGPVWKWSRPSRNRDSPAGVGRTWQISLKESSLGDTGTCRAGSTRSGCGAPFSH